MSNPFLGVVLYNLYISSKGVPSLWLYLCPLLSNCGKNGMFFVKIALTSFKTLIWPLNRRDWLDSIIQEVFCFQIIIGVDWQVWFQSPRKWRVKTQGWKNNRSPKICSQNIWLWLFNIGIELSWCNQFGRQLTSKPSLLAWKR